MSVSSGSLRLGSAGGTSQTSHAARYGLSAPNTDRYAGDSIRTNAELTPRLTATHCAIDAAGMRLLDTAIRRMALSARGFDRVRKVARTIADLAAEDRIRADHIAEALQFRVQ